MSDPWVQPPADPTGPPTGRPVDAPVPSYPVPGQLQPSDGLPTRSGSYGRYESTVDPLPVRSAARIAAVAAGLAFVVPTAIGVGYPTLLTNLIQMIQFVSRYPQLVVSLVISFAQVGLVIATLVLGARWLTYQPGQPGASSRTYVGVLTAVVGAVTSILAAASFIEMRITPIPVAGLCILVAGLALARAGRLASRLSI